MRGTAVELDFNISAAPPASVDEGHALPIGHLFISGSMQDQGRRIRTKRPLVEMTLQATGGIKGESRAKTRLRRRRYCAGRVDGNRGDGGAAPVGPSLQSNAISYHVIASAQIG